MAFRSLLQKAQVGVNASIPQIAIVGAGISGLACANVLVGGGYAPQIFDKSRGAGGRLSTRRLDGGISFDHGAQYFTARDPLFQKQVADWEQQGLVAQWNGRIGQLQRGAISIRPDQPQRWVALPTMTSLPKQLAKNLTLQVNTRVAPLAKSASTGWELFSDQQRPLGKFDWVISCAPPAQSADLLAVALSLASKIATAHMRPCWALLVQFAQPIAIPLDGAFVEDSPLSWIARNSSKPGRVAAADCWVLHASAEWSAVHLEKTPEQVLPQLLTAFWEATAMPPQAFVYATAHRWRYAIPENPLAESFLLDENIRLAACGDWCGGPRVEGAYLSGCKLGERLLEILATS